MPDIDELARRPTAYQFETGVSQLTCGLIFSLLGVSDLLQRFLPERSVAQEAPKLLATCGVVAVLWGSKALKERVVLPRGGYAEVLPRKCSRLEIAAAATIMIFTVFLMKFEDRLLFPGFAVLFAVITLGYGWRNKSSLVVCFGVYLLCLAPVLWLLPITHLQQAALLEVGVGAPLAVGGAFILRRFLKANPKRLETSNE